MARWGIIPALAGNTGAGCDSGISRGDHPRSRGEYICTAYATPCLVGSSPLSRGIPDWFHRRRATPRIIPALAGNTSAASPKPTPTPDHPRSRGEYAGDTWEGIKNWGSSPLSRGIHPPGLSTSRRGGIIPALAGNTPALGVGVAGGQDHPRSRGEYVLGVGAAQRQRGSSPLSRGILTSIHTGLGVSRIIPALAGNTSPPRELWSARTDHPRSRGEYPGFEGFDRVESGSSPLSRGIHPREVEHREAPRIIPALAGNTETCAPPAITTRDHPRSRGEYGYLWRLLHDFEGSSPLSRGILTQPVMLENDPGIIPALAGNTSEAHRDHVHA